MLEEKVATLQPPQWSREIFGLDTELAEKGRSAARDLGN
jgi:hypothetical protein